MKRRTLLAASALMYRIKLHQYLYNFVKKQTCVQGVLHTTVRTITTKVSTVWKKRAPRDRVRRNGGLSRLTQVTRDRDNS